MSARSWLAILIVTLIGAGCGGDDGGTGPADGGGDGGGGGGGGDGGGGGETTQKPTTLPAFASLGLYSATSPFNQRIPDNPAIDARSTAYVTKLITAGDLVVQAKQYSSPVYFADANTPRVEVALPCGTTWEIGVTHLQNVPMPTHAEPSVDSDGAGNPPSGCGEESDQDNNLVILDTASRCEFDFWQARRVGSTWTASWGNATPMDGTGIFPTGLSIRGSGFAFLGGLIWPDEIVNGRIGHRLVFSSPFTRSGGPVAPATDSDGITNDADALPIGALLQLDPSLDLSSLGLDPWSLTIARAMQEFGLMLVDTGGDGSLGLYAIDPRSAATNPYGTAWPDQDFVEVSGIPLDRLRVLQLPEQDGDWTEGLSLQNNSCTSFR